MTIFRARENRAGKKISAKNLQQLANAHHALKAVAADAGVDLDDILPEAGPDGTIGGGQVGSAQTDGTGMRGHVPPTIRMTSSGVRAEVRG